MTGPGNLHLGASKQDLDWHSSINHRQGRTTAQPPVAILFDLTVSPGWMWTDAVYISWVTRMDVDRCSLYLLGLLPRVSWVSRSDSKSNTKDFAYFASRTPQRFTSTTQLEREESQDVR